MFVPLVAREVDVQEVIVPQAPAGFSAWGMLMTDLIQEYSETTVGLLSHIGIDSLRAVAQRLGRQAGEDLTRGGFAATDSSIEWATSLRYFGQEHTLDTPLRENDDIESLCGRFERGFGQGSTPHASQRPGARAASSPECFSEPSELSFLSTRRVARSRTAREQHVATTSGQMGDAHCNRQEQPTATTAKRPRHSSRCAPRCLRRPKVSGRFCLFVEGSG